jgi:hypothetical protein
MFLQWGQDRNNTSQGVHNSQEKNGRTDGWNEGKSYQIEVWPTMPLNWKLD